MTDAAVDSSSEITTKGLKEKKEVGEASENGRDACANGNANKENGEQQGTENNAKIAFQSSQWGKSLPVCGFLSCLEHSRDCFCHGETFLQEAFTKTRGR